MAFARVMAMQVLRHVGLKLLSLALAVLLWTLVAGQKEAERSLRVPLEFQNMPESLEMIGEPPSFVDVRVKGPSTTLGQLRGTELIVTVELSAARPGRRMFHLLPDHVTTPVGVRALGVVPPTVPLMFETSATKTVPVVPAIDGEPADGYVRGRVTASPKTVEVVGPESVIRELTQATTEPVNLRGAMGRVRDTVTIGVPESSVRLKVPRNAIVVVEVNPAPVHHTIRGVPIILRHLRRGLRASVVPPAVAVSARGAAGVVTGLAAERVPVFVDLNGLRRGRYNLPVRIDATAGFSITGTDPAAVQVTIK
jgi:YbbR domain-containing protein